ncbi:carboxymuconolactone decarboxylase family protein [Amycolatopsis roodepoortensis]|uniref:AhpD family alkylhydroperoxidase n=1 Tax=Amycolatopsis roodepoortensis TaxID=700274 RepID=A0ABR9L4C0_9PSEU|nr:carboxymuconolactone decarboxylase family protein [Amycolatopsis roodepoortensis]MBE1575407.1 AhpD family alkylhydroperoxidase [Amycolatopsis roodepoortensis]
MQRLKSLDPADAPAKSAELLGDIVERRGSVGPMVSAMANSPALLQGYLDFSRAMKRVKIPRPLSEKISLALQEWIGCALCLDAHTRAALKTGLTEADVALARQGTSTDRREAALIAYAVRVLAEPASLGDEDIAELREHGWSDQIIADTVGLVSLNLLTGSFNLVAGLEPTPADQSTKEKHNHVG